MADFNFYLNRQGVQGRKGDQGEQGFSPVISVNSETANEYTLRIQNEDYEIITPNLRGNHIEYTGGTYIRINPETEQLYTGLIDQATTSTYGGVILAADGALEAGTDYTGVVSAGDIHDYVESKIGEAGLNFDDLTNSLVAGDNITLDVNSTNETITINSTASSNYTAGSNINITNNVISAENVVTTNTDQLTITGAKGFTYYNTTSVGGSKFFIGNRTGQTVDVHVGASNTEGGVMTCGGSLILGTSVTNGTTGHSIYLPYQGYNGTNKNAFIIQKATYDNTLEDEYIEPIFTSKTLLAGNGVSITASGTKLNKTYTISATGGDLSNYVTLDTTQTITAEKNFNRNLPSRGTTNTCLRAGSTSSLHTHNMVMGINSTGVPFLSTYGANCGTYIGNADGFPVCFLKRPDSVGYGMPSVCVQYASQLAPNEYTQSNTYPLFNALNFTAGSGVTITTTGTGAGTTYEISTTGTITVDSTLSLTSTNPVQNAVITQTLNNKQDTLTQTQLNNISLGGTALQPNDNISELTNDSGYITSASLPIVDQTYDGTSTNPQSGIAIAGELTNYALSSSVPTDTSDLTNGAGFITGITSSDITAALGYTPYNSSNPNGYTSNIGTVTSVNNVSPVNGNVTLSIPTDTSDLTNGAGFLTSVPTATLSSLGVVQPDGTTIDINNGIISAVAQTPTVIDGGEETVV